jgi:hypothetical protein
MKKVFKIMESDIDYWRNDLSHPSIQRSVNSKDILLILLSWVLHKILDFAWKKIHPSIRNLKIKPLRSLLTIAEWVSQFTVRLLYRDILEHWKTSQIENWVKELNTDERQKRHFLYVLLQAKSAR